MWERGKTLGGVWEGVLKMKNDLVRLFNEAKKIKSKYKLSSKEMDDIIEEGVVRRN